MLWLLCCLPVLTGCIGEEDYANDPVGNFEQLWKIIDEQYCFCLLYTSPSPRD